MVAETSHLACFCEWSAVLFASPGLTNSMRKLSGRVHCHGMPSPYPRRRRLTCFEQTLPVAIVRWMAFNRIRVPFPATVFASVLFASSGVLNVILYSATRPKLIPHRPPVSMFTNPTSSDWLKSTSSRSHRRDDSGSDAWDEESRLRIEVRSTRTVEIAPPMPAWSSQQGSRNTARAPVSFLDPLDGSDTEA